MKLEDIVLRYLESEPRFRERENKNRGIVNLLLKKYPQFAGLKKETLISFTKDASSYDRAWRRCLELNEGLRGSDYNKKTMLQQKKILELGYQPGIKRDIKLLKKMTM